MVYCKAYILNHIRGLYLKNIMQHERYIYKCIVSQMFCMNLLFIQVTRQTHQWDQSTTASSQRSSPSDNQRESGAQTDS